MRDQAGVVLDQNQTRSRSKGMLGIFSIFTRQMSQCYHYVDRCF